MKGQITFDALMYLVLMTLFLGALMPVWLPAIDDLVEQSSGNPVALGFIILIIPSAIYALIKSVQEYSRMRQ